MSNKSAFDKYKENSVYGASPEELTLMLYNGLIKFIMQAQSGVNEKDIERTHTGCIKAQNILYEFINTLDHKYPVSKNLNSLYDYMIRRLIEANTKKDNDILEEVLGYSRELRDTWAEAMKLAKTQNNDKIKSTSVDETSDYKVAQVIK